MKKFLLTSALILALVLSLTAGTMAAYNQKVATLSSDVDTKEMFVTADLTQEAFAVDFKIAPGDKIVRKIKLTYAGEIPADTTLVAEIAAASGSLLPLGVKLKVEQVSATETGDEVGKNTGGTVWTAKANLRDARNTAEYVVTVDWPYDTDIKVTNLADTQKPFVLSVGVDAKSVNKNLTNGEA